MIESSSEEKKETQKSDLPFQSNELTTEDRTTPPVQEVQQSLSVRDDAVDVQIQDHSKEVDKDAKTNPVEQNKKRVLREENEVNFLQNDSMTAEPKRFGQSHLDEEFMQHAQEGELNEDNANEEIEEDQEIEHASDDEEVFDFNNGNVASRLRGRNRRIDDDYEENNEIEGVEEEDSDDAPMDDLEPEHIDDEEDAAKKKAKPTKGFSRQHRTDIVEANLEGDEAEETVFIDNLPNDEIQIKAMLGQVAKHIAALEKRFFEEENSD